MQHDEKPVGPRTRTEHSGTLALQLVAVSDRNKLRIICIPMCLLCEEVAHR